MLDTSSVIVIGDKPKNKQQQHQHQQHNNNKDPANPKPNINTATLDRSEHLTNIASFSSIL